MNSDDGTGSANPECAGILRRIGAMIYDSLLLIAVLFVAAIPFNAVAISRKKLLVPSEVGNLIYGIFLLWLFVVIVLFFGYFWTKRGQTLGMQVWKLRVEDNQSRLLTWPTALKRLLLASILWAPGFACLSVSEQLHSLALKWSGVSMLLLVLLNVVVVRLSATHQTWHERLSATRVVVQRNLRVSPKDSSS